MAELTFRNATRDEYPKIKALYESYFGKNYYAVAKPYFDWLHGDSPWAPQPEDEFTSLCAFEGDALLACLNYTPIRLRVGAQTYRASWTPGWLAADGAGLASGLLINRYFKTAEYFISMGLSANMKALYAKRPGVQYKEAFPRWVMVTDAAALKTVLARDPQPQTTDLAALEQLAAAARAAAAPYHRKTTLEALGEDWRAGLIQRAHVFTDKTPAYLSWRYFAHPSIDYAVIGEQETGGGVAVLRLEEIAEPKTIIGRITEFLPRPGGEAALTGAVAGYLQAHGAAFADFFCAAARYGTALPAPFAPPEAHAPFRIPRLFQPLEWRARDSINASLCKGAGWRSLPDIDFSSFYLTKGDSSQDVNVNPEYKTRAF